MRNLSLHEQKTWGPCPVCRVKHGVPCSHRTRSGATHLSRVMRAPRAVSAWHWCMGCLISAVNRALARPAEQGR